MKTQLFLLNRVVVVVSFLLLSTSVFSANSSEERITRSDYIATWKDVAIQNMKEFKIPASITMAQAILESGDGNSELAKISNNHFGIKCHDWKGKRVYYDDDKKGECFRKYKDASASFADHSKFLLRNRYASLFDLDIKDYKGWAKGLKKCGYATNPAYARLLIDLIEKNGLDKLDNDYSASNEEFLAQTELKEEETPSESVRDSKKKRPKIPSSITLTSGRTIKVSDNNIKFIEAKKDDSPEKIANDVGLPVWLVRKYNDLDANGVLSEGELVYIQPKRGKAQKAVYVVKQGDTMRGISQAHGIKLKSLYKKNSLKFGSEPQVGTKLLLKGKVK